MKSIISLICLVTFTLNLSGQKVGLVLSGGGAKGLAHISVIKALEENGIPIDYIAGTSMGAIIAGLYAAGFSTNEMDSLFRSEQFKFWSTGKIEEKYRYYFRKLDDDPSWLEIDLLKKDDKIKVLPPTNLIPEEQMDFAFMEMFSSVTAINKGDFNKLFVPFFCIATDVYNNKEIVLRSGDLGEAIRGSMTFPMYFKPIEIDGNLVFDGGIVNNFPVQNMKELFNPDIIIGHNVANNPERPDPDDLMAQIENMIMRKTEYSIDPEDGILMQTTFNNIGLLDFKKIDLIRNAGTETVNKHLDYIKSRIKKRVQPDEIKQLRYRFNMKKPQLIFQNIQVEGVNDPAQHKYIIQSLKHNSNVIDLDNLKKEYFKLTADPQIKSLRPIAQYNPETGYFDLHLIAKSNPPANVKFGGNISTRPINQGFLSAEYRMFKNRSYTYSTNMYFGRFYSSIKAGARIDFPTRLPFYWASYFTLNRWDYYSSTTEFVFEDVRPPYIIQNEGNLRAEFGFPVKSSGKFILGTAYSNARDSYYLTESIKISDTPDNTVFDVLTTNASLTTNTLNDKQYPTEGVSSNVTINYISGNEKNLPGTTSNNQLKKEYKHNYILLKANYERYFRINKLLTIGAMAEAVYSDKKPFSNYVSTVLSAPTFDPIPHSKTIYLNRFHANKYIASGVKGIMKFSDLWHLRTEIYGFTPIREIQETTNYNAIYADKKFSTIKFMGTGALVYQSAIGPVSLSLNYYDKSQTRMFAMLNVGYILFNRRGF